VACRGEVSARAGVARGGPFRRGRGAVRHSLSRGGGGGKKERTGVVAGGGGCVRDNGSPVA